jgi:membrane-bound lytic murein transglycosylase D
MKSPGLELNFGHFAQAFVLSDPMKKIITLVFFALTISNEAWMQVFERPPSLLTQINFWTKIYSFYDSNQVIFHDQHDQSLIYAVLDLPRVHQELSAPKFKSEVQKRYQEIQSVLEHIALGKKAEFLLDDWERITNLLKSKNIKQKSDLAKRLRSQSGLRSQFARGLKNSGRFIDEMRSILKAQGLPEDLVALVFVESMFFPVISHAGAGGQWGIMEETALRLGIFVNKFTDERMDPVISTLAAAQFLKKAKEGLGEWPLAITAYNYGYSGMLRAVNNLGTQKIEEIIKKHESPIFGFACKNYYTEFLAALDVYNQREKYFPEIKPDAPWRYEIVQVLKPVNITDLISARAFTKEELASFNPSLSKRTLEGHEVIPSNFTLRVPFGKSKHFYNKLKAIPKARRAQAEEKISFKYRANGKESLSLIARKHGLNEDFLIKKFKAKADYQPKGMLNIRSEAHLFSELDEITRAYIAIAQPPKVTKTAKAKALVKSSKAPPKASTAARSTPVKAAAIAGQ